MPNCAMLRHGLKTPSINFYNMFRFTILTGNLGQHIYRGLVYGLKKLLSH